MAQAKVQLQSVQQGEFNLDAFRLNLALAGSPQKALLEFSARLKSPGKARP